jgi:hypothetical protein
MAKARLGIVAMLGLRRHGVSSRGVHGFAEAGDRCLARAWSGYELIVGSGDGLAGDPEVGGRR